VEVAAQAAALLLAGGNEALARALQLSGLGSERCVQSSAQSRVMLLAVVPVHEPVHTSLERRPKRLHEEGDEPGRDKREPEVGTLLDEGGEPAH
jgi:hypothetical protein